jgi:hypothetical protein
MKHTNRDYDNFKFVAFSQYGIPGQILDVVRPWVEKECGKDFWSHDDDLGYAELGRITTLDQALKELQVILTMMKVDGKRTYNNFLKDAGGRVGKGFYRKALKAYYLMGA